MKLSKITIGISFGLIGSIAVVNGEPIMCSDGVTMGYSTFSSLKQAIESSGSNKAFTVCPGTVLSTDGTDKGIQFPSNGHYILRCGYNGRLQNNCVFQGGPRHLSPGSTDLSIFKHWEHNINVYGMTFRGATDASIELQSSSNGYYTFRDCLWEENVFGLFVKISVYRSLDKYIKFRNCQWIRNHGYAIKITSTYYRDPQDVHLEVDNCVFLENEPHSNYPDLDFVIATKNIMVENSCFVGNEVSQGGALVSYVDDLPVNSNNYSRNNTIDAGCNGIEHDGLCLPFDSASCVAEPCLSEEPPCTDLPTSWSTCDFNILEDLDTGGKCRSELNALDFCAVNQISSTSCVACRDCAVSVAGSNTLYSSSSCAENEAKICQELNNCDSDCGICSNEFEDYYECLWMNIGTGCGGLNCDTPEPTLFPTPGPTEHPTSSPTKEPTRPLASPIVVETIVPTNSPSASPSTEGTTMPTSTRTSASSTVKGTIPSTVMTAIALIALSVH